VTDEEFRAAPALTELRSADSTDYVRRLGGYVTGAEKNKNTSRTKMKDKNDRRERTSNVNTHG